jgi:hypothetical protein
MVLAFFFNYSIAVGPAAFRHAGPERGGIRVFPALGTLFGDMYGKLRGRGLPEIEEMPLYPAFRQKS